MFHKRFQRGQSLIEVVVAVGIILSGVTALITLSISSLKADQVSSRKIIAVNLAREGLEVVRNIRDSNWLAGLRDDCSGTQGISTDDWFAGFVDPGEECTAGITHQMVPVFDATTHTWSVVPSSGAADEQVYLTAQKLYIQPDPGSATRTTYTRTMSLTPHNYANAPTQDCLETVTPGKCDQITHFDVLVTVTYDLNGKIYTTQAAEQLYNWKP